MAEPGLSVDQQIRLEAIKQATLYYSMKMKLLRNSNELFDANSEDAVLGFATKLAKYIKLG